ncbi:Mss4-like protein [Mycena alexandri]|uniref:Mss4-like protein n=1 Tax=Mycena alexandri TaxID=1745969 RepID=A0AAD6WRI0_9AGAR|nr:Mss4-like protein [Mycena alexandri]KAJ7040230.1 Mss4-like protein [Mycena alexandri]
MSESPETITRKGGCACGSVTYAVVGKPLFSIYCHCTQCQRADGAAFVGSMHYADSAHSWTYTAENEPDVEPLGDMVLYRCKKCRSCAATQFPGNKNWALRSTQLERDENGKVINWEGVKPTSHIFYGTRVVDVADDLPKWEGHAGRSTRLN